jgi:hypothetical protein
MTLVSWVVIPLDLLPGKSCVKLRRAYFIPWHQNRLKWLTGTAESVIMMDNSGRELKSGSLEYESHSDSCRSQFYFSSFISRKALKQYLIIQLVRPLDIFLQTLNNIKSALCSRLQKFDYYNTIYNYWQENAHCRTKSVETLPIICVEKKRL